MCDPWDELNNHPSRIKTALFGTKTFLARLENREGELLTFFGEVDWKEDSQGVTVTDIRYWPIDEDMRDSVVDYVMTEVVRS